MVINEIGNEILKRGSKWDRCREESSRISNFGNCTKRKGGKPDVATAGAISTEAAGEWIGTEAAEMAGESDRSEKPAEARGEAGRSRKPAESRGEAGRNEKQAEARGEASRSGEPTEATESQCGPGMVAA